MNTHKPLTPDMNAPQAWSRLNQVNLLASGIGTNWYNSGSGIYSKGVALQSFYNAGTSPEGKVLVSAVTTTRSGTSGASRDAPLSMKRLRSTNWVAKTFEARPGASDTLRVTTGNLECEATYIVASDSATAAGYDTYGLVALNGEYNGLFQVQYCGLMLCPSTKNSSCTEYAMEVRPLSASARESC